MTMEIPVWKKQNMTVQEAASYSGIGLHKLYELTDDRNCEFVLRIGNKRLINRKKFDIFLESAFLI